MTDILTFVVIIVAAAAFGGFCFWLGWDWRGDIEWNEQHGIDQKSDCTEE